MHGALVEVERQWVRCNPKGQQNSQIEHRRNAGRANSEN